MLNNEDKRQAQRNVKGINLMSRQISSIEFEMSNAT